MKIGIDISCWNNQRGFGRYTRSLVRSLLEVDRNNDYVLFLDSITYDNAELPSGARRVIVPTRERQEEAISPKGRRRVKDLFRMTSAVAREPLDLFFFPSIDGYFPIIRPSHRIVAIHDVIPEMYPQLTLLDLRSRFMRRLKVWVALKQAGRVVTGSEYTRRNLLRVFRLPEERVKVVPYGVDDIFHPPGSRETAQSKVSEKYGIRSPYFIYVGDNTPHKNLPALIRAFDRLAKRSVFGSTSLVIVGLQSPGPPEGSGGAMNATHVSPGSKNRIRRLGFQPDDQLRVLYQGARALILPSLMEGYGLPGIEAVACGTPVIVTRESPLPDLLSGAVIGFDPLNERDLGRAMETVLGNPVICEKLRNAAKEYAGRFSWMRSAERAMEVFRKAGSDFPDPD